MFERALGMFEREAGKPDMFQGEARMFESWDVYLRGKLGYLKRQL